jgi:hypothetical protein
MAWRGWGAWEREVNWHRRVFGAAGMALSNTIGGQASSMDSLSDLIISHLYTAHAIACDLYIYSR